jgi:hypothetical protein
MHIKELPRRLAHGELAPIAFGGVRADDGFGAGLLIFIPVIFLLMAFLIFRGGGGVEAALRLLARVFQDPVVGPRNEAMTDSALGVQAEMGIAGIGISPLKPGMRAMKLSKAYGQAYDE